MTHRMTTCPSPVGTLTLVAGDAGLAAILWDGDDPARVPIGPVCDAPGDALLAETARQLGDYFAKRRTGFDLPLAPVGTEFQRAVWAALCAIPYGEVRSYAEIARGLGRPGASRAVGAANGRNPISIVVPCHRVVGTSGAMTGFAGGVAAKRRLLELEGALLIA